MYHAETIHWEALYTVAVLCPHWSVNEAFIWVSFSRLIQCVYADHKISISYHTQLSICNWNEQMHYAIIKTSLDRGIVFFCFFSRWVSFMSVVNRMRMRLRNLLIRLYLLLRFFSALFSPFFHLFISLPLYKTFPSRK